MVFAPIKRWKSRYITRLADFQNLHGPTDSAEEANVLGLAFALIFLMLPSSHFGLRASPTNMTSESDEKVALCEPATLSQEVQNFFAEVRPANWDGWFRLWIRPAIVALHLRSVSWPSMNFHGLLCHPWPCMSLKLRFVAGSIPSALTKPFQRFTAHRHPFSSDHCGCCYITYFRWLRRSTTALICDVSGWRYRGVQALVPHDFFDQSRIPRPAIATVAKVCPQSH